MLTFISNSDHYKEVLSRVSFMKRSFWIGTADIKDLCVDVGKEGDIDIGIKTVRLGVFDFRSFLNLGKLLTTSEKAKQVRSMMLDIVIAVVSMWKETRLLIMKPLWI